MPTSFFHGREPLTWIRFLGEQLDYKAIPIDSLGQILIAYQRIINKAFLAQNNVLSKHARLSLYNQQDVQLQLTAHEEGSDVYGLSSFTTDPIIAEILQDLLTKSLLAIGTYALKKVFLKDKKETEGLSENKSGLDTSLLENQDFISLIYPLVSAKLA